MEAVALDENALPLYVMLGGRPIEEYELHKWHGSKKYEEGVVEEAINETVRQHVGRDPSDAELKAFLNHYFEESIALLRNGTPPGKLRDSLNPKKDFPRIWKAMLEAEIAKKEARKSWKDRFIDELYKIKAMGENLDNLIEPVRDYIKFTEQASDSQFAGSNIVPGTRTVDASQAADFTPENISPPQMTSFTETYSGLRTAIPDFPGASGSTLTSANVMGERTGILPAELNQQMNGRFEAFAGPANTLINVPINGEITGTGIVINGQPVNSEARLVQECCIGDFETATGPFTINPDGTSSGTFKGNTFDPSDPDVLTGDVTIHYSAQPK